MKKVNWIYFLLIAFVLILWASAFVAIRHALEAFSAAHLAFLRYLIASLCFMFIAFFQKISWPRREDLPACALLGFSGFTLYNLLLNHGERTVDAGLASFIVNASPFFALLFTAWRKVESITPRDWFYFAVAFSGVAVIIFSKNTQFSVNADALLILGAAVSQGYYFVLQKSFLNRYSPLEITSYAVWFGTLFLFPFASGSWEACLRSDTAHLATLLYLGIFPASVAYLIVAYALHRYKMSNFASYFFLVPFIALFIAYLFLGEQPGWVALAGGLLIIAGILLKNGMLFNSAGQQS